MNTSMTGRSRGAMGGIIAGLIAGAVLAAFLMLMNAMNGQDIWLAAKGAGAPFIGERAAQPGFAVGPVLIGILSHFAVSAGWGLLFGLICHGLSKGFTVPMGALWGIVVWLAMHYAVLPIVGLGEMARSTPIAMAIISHLVFGVTLGVAFLPFQREKHVPERPAERQASVPS
jgi:hypothetical protein